MKIWKTWIIFVAILVVAQSAVAEGDLLIGVYSLNEKLRDEANLQMLENAQIDILLDVPADQQLLDLCLAHNIQVIVNNEFPGWWGGDGTNAGQYQDILSLSEVDAYADSALDHTAIWGDYLIDEPNCEDYSWISKVFHRYSQHFRSRRPFINLHPFYDDETSISMLGAPYMQYLQEYIDTIPTSYISFDSYPYSNPELYGKTFLYGYDAVAEICRKNGKEMWVTQQVGGWEAQDQLMEFQIRLQTNIALTYGAQGIIYASWSADWWDDETTCVSNDGKRNLAADYVEQINREIRSIESVYLTYRNLCVLPLGNLDAADEYIRPQIMQLRKDSPHDPFGVCRQVESDGAILCGCFENSFGDKAIMLTNVTSLFDDSVDANVRVPFATSGWINGDTIMDTAEFTLRPGDAAFLLISQ